MATLKELNIRVEDIEEKIATNRSESQLRHESHCKRLDVLEDQITILRNSISYDYRLISERLDDNHNKLNNRVDFLDNKLSKLNNKLVEDEIKWYHFWKY